MVILIGTDAHAGVNDRGFYIGLRALPAVSDAADEAIAGGPGGTLKQNGDDPELTIGAGIMVGYHWRSHDLPLRLEIEYAHRLQLDFDAENSGPPLVGYKNDVTSDSLMFNAYFDFATDTPWRPYVGVGLGWARNESDVERTNLATSARESRSETVNNFAYSLQTGVRVAISESWVGELGYRFLDMGEIETGSFTTGDAISADHYYSHDIVFGLAYMF
ncbi:MAG: outer membrane beta-barrel protein [Pseudomonadota bacterium]|nr:outer membrane beta-barrel protein [Pseudomonadota bacterium]